MQKPRPVPDIRYVLRPEEDLGYQHFENGLLHPFDAQADYVTRRNAWWLADAAFLAYWEPSFVIERFVSAAYEAEFLQSGGTQAFVAWRDDMALAVFRGTEADRLEDIFDDALFRPEPWDVGWVHRGFKDAFERVWASLSALLAAAAPRRRVWFGGHSLGAAMATLGAMRFPETAGVCTFGSPRVGDREFAAAFRARLGGRALRYVNDADIVTHVPPPLPYQHVGELRHIDPEGNIEYRPPQLSHFFPALIGDPVHVAEVVQGLRTQTLTRPPDFLLDHAPRHYAVDLWNDYYKARA